MNISGDWSDPMPAYHGDFITGYSSCLDSQDNVHIVIKDYVIYYTNNTSGGFITPILASSPEHEHPIEPQVAIDSNGNAHIVYRAPFTTGEPDLYYVNNLSGSFISWVPLDEAFGLHAKPNIAIDDSDFVHIVYKSSPAYEGLLYYGNNISGDFTFTTYDKMSDWWVPQPRYFVLGRFSTIHFAFYEWMGEVYASDTEIFYLRGILTDKDDILGTWDGSGVWYRNSETGSWVKMSTPADLVAAGDLDGDSTDDLIGVWSSGL